jgi:hypothetical protein
MGIGEVTATATIMSQSSALAKQSSASNFDRVGNAATSRGTLGRYLCEVRAGQYWRMGETEVL